MSRARYVVLAALLGVSCGRLGFQRLGGPETPVIDGELSAGHLDLLWRWSTPDGTQTFQYAIDGAAPVMVDVAMTEAMFAAPGPGSYTIEVQACADGVCSLPAQFTTVVELFGAGRGPAWEGVERASVAQTPLGRWNGAICDDCAGSGADAAAASARLGRALSRGADAVEIGIALVQDELVIGADGGTGALLSEVLADATLRASDAVIVLDVREDDAAADAFATALLDLLDTMRPQIVRNGRPIWIRATRARSRYLAAIRAAEASVPFVAHYVRLHLTFEGAALMTRSSFASAIASEVAGFDGVQLECTSPNLFFGIALAESNHLVVTLSGIAPESGDVLVGALREHADALDLRYRVDRARQVIEEQNTVLWLDPDRETDRTQVILRRASSQGQDTQMRPLGRAATATLHGTPTAVVEPAAAPFSGTALRFDRASEQAIDAWDLDVVAGRRLLVTAAVSFADLMPQVILTKAEMGGWVLEIKTAAGTGATTLDFGVFSGADFVRHSYAVTNLSTDRSYFLIGVWSANDEVTLYIDGAPLATPAMAPASGYVASPVPILVGADPQPAVMLGTRFFLNGDLQQAMVLDWVGAPAGASEVND